MYCSSQFVFKLEFCSFSRSLLIISYIFSICAASILFSTSWIEFTIITLNYFSGRFPSSFSFSWSCGFLHCSFVCHVFLCHLILSNLLSFLLLFCSLQGQVAPVSTVCPLVGEYNRGVCVGFLLGGPDACPLVDGTGFCPFGGQDCVKVCV